MDITPPPTDYDYLDTDFNFFEQQRHRNEPTPKLMDNPSSEYDTDTEDNIPLTVLYGRGHTDTEDDIPSQSKITSSPILDSQEGDNNNPPQHAYATTPASSTAVPRAALLRPVIRTNPTHSDKHAPSKPPHHHPSTCQISWRERDAITSPPPQLKQTHPMDTTAPTDYDYIDTDDNFLEPQPHPNEPISKLVDNNPSSDYDTDTEDNIPLTVLFGRWQTDTDPPQSKIPSSSILDTQEGDNNNDPQQHSYATTPSSSTAVPRAALLRPAIRTNPTNPDKHTSSKPPHHPPATSFSTRPNTPPPVTEPSDRPEPEPD
jgi:hypothetical protein